MIKVTCISSGETLKSLNFQSVKTNVQRASRRIILRLLASLESIIGFSQLSYGRFCSLHQRLLVDIRHRFSGAISDVIVRRWPHLGESLEGVGLAQVNDEHPYIRVADKLVETLLQVRIGLEDER